MVYIKNKKGISNTIIIVAIMIIFFATIVTVIYTYFDNNNMTSAEDKILFDQVDASQTYSQKAEDKSTVRVVTDIIFGWFSDDDDQDNNQTSINSGTYEEKTYYEATQKKKDIEDYYNIIVNLPKLIGDVTGLSGAAQVITFLALCITVWLAIISYKEVLRWMGRA